MLGPAHPAQIAAIHTADGSSSSNTSASSSRPSRLRGLSYLRTYTRDHLHSRSTTDPPLRSPPLTRSTSSPTNVPTNSSFAGTSQENIRSTEERNNNRIHTAENGWVPTIQGRSGLNRDSPQSTSTSTESASPDRRPAMTRARTADSSTNLASATSNRSAQPDSSSMATESSPSTAGPSNSNNTSKDKSELPAIRFIPHIESRSSRPSLQFSALSRTLKSPSSVVRVGRYSERDNTSSDPDILPVGFKSKVVSRRHCEFWCTDGQWFIKDVKSSSGTFLNHVRLSSPGVESRPYPINDGDVVQLGIDFKGGEEVIFRCVKIRIECNRNWQKSLNSFNKSAHKQLLRSALKPKARDSDAASVNSSECSICLNPVAPCQALFVAPCSHVWHYKCVRDLIHGPNFPNFLCPNCRFVADLEEDVEPPEEEEEEEFEEFGGEDEMHVEEADERTDEVDEAASQHEGQADSAPRVETVPPPSDLDDDFTHLISHVSIADFTPPANEASNGSSETAQPLHPPGTAQTTSTPTPIRSDPISIPVSSSSRTPSMVRTSSTRSTNRSNTATDTDGEGGAQASTFVAREGLSLGSSPSPMGVGVLLDNGPMTPRNDVGPWVFDGSSVGNGDSLVGRAVGDEVEVGERS